ncbi:MAG: hypothetical protein HY741_09105 [Chloroflexi bacterium]|nr:hypothetical protein [Chloroflexota bacterium]
MPAIERYDGVNYRVIHKLQREGKFPENVDVKILSAKFGLIDAQTPIPHYDQRMDKQRANELQAQVAREWKKINEKQYKEIFINMGKTYLVAMGGFDLLPPSAKVRFAEGGIGKKMAAMKLWLQQM